MWRESKNWFSYSEAMSSPEEMLHEVGAYEPIDAKKVLSAFEAQGIPFEIETDSRDLSRPEGSAGMAWGIYGSGSKLVIFVPASSVARAEAIIAEMFPV